MTHPPFQAKPLRDPVVDALLRCWVEQREELLRSCRRALGRADGEEAFSRATLSMLQATAPTGGIRRPAAWLQEIMRHACVDLHRERTRRGRLLLIVDEDLGERAASPQAAARDPERTFLERETLARLEGAIRALSPALRAPLLLRVEEGLSYAEMAALLLESEENLRKRVQIARQRVRRSVLLQWEQAPRRPAGDHPAPRAGRPGLRRGRARAAAAIDPVHLSSGPSRSQ
ncbi:RNA polymerase sigma factor [Sorangium sp. So ce1335]|uniref:RNA polymerase sigma factor n=1 Tax=Sorangium sp. So ce1335 TaxID=3133335 RepID=UPI003F6278CE